MKINLLLPILIASIIPTIKMTNDEQHIIYNYFKKEDIGDIKLLGIRNDISFYFVKSLKLQNFYSKETISNLEFKYNKNEMIIPVLNGERYTIKSLFLKNKISLVQLETILNVYNKSITTNSSDFVEINGEAIVLKERIINLKPTEENKNIIEIDVQQPFGFYNFSQNDFKDNKYLIFLKQFKRWSFCNGEDVIDNTFKLEIKSQYLNSINKIEESLKKYDFIMSASMSWSNWKLC